MNELYDFLRTSGMDAGLATGLLSIVLRGAMILVLAMVASLLLRRAAASTRHLAWMLAIVAVLLLPFLGAALPSWNVPLLSGAYESLRAPAATMNLEPAEKSDEGLILVKSEGSTRVEARRAAVAAGDAPEAAAVSSRLTGVLTASAASLLLMVWLVGAATILLYILLGMVGAWRLAASARPVRDASWLEALDEMIDRLDVRRPVQLLSSHEARVPMVWGVVRPVVLLPDDAQTWDAERQKCVLAHELAHVRRLDTLTQMAAGLACALHWPNPLVWKAAHRMRLEREHACDEQVLRSVRTKPSRYATHLMNIAQHAPSSLIRPAGAVSMARRSQLEGRILSILESPERQTETQPAGWTVALVALLLVIPIAAVNPVAQPGAPVWSGPAAISAPAAPHAGPALYAGRDDLIHQVFSVAPGGSLFISSDNGNIEVRTHSRDEVRLEVQRTPRGRATADDFIVSSNQAGNEVRIRGESRRLRGGDGVNVQFIVTIPARFDVSLKTGGGNISVDDLDGHIEAETSGGNLALGRVTGKVRAQTSGGNIHLQDTEGDVDVQTSGGDLRIGQVGGRVRARTSGGNINVAGAEGNLDVSTSGGNVRLGRILGAVEAHTSGGNIDVDEVGGPIDAQTSGGSIQARITKQPAADSRLKTSGGNVTVYLAEGLGLEIEANADGGTVQSEVPIVSKGSLREDHVRGTIGGGGPRLVLEGGFVQIKRL